jgi:hypothetical protein
MANRFRLLDLIMITTLIACLTAIAYPFIAR